MPDRNEEMRKLIGDMNNEIDALYAEIRSLERSVGDKGASDTMALAEKRRKLAKLREECAEMMRKYFDLNPPFERGEVESTIEEFKKILEEKENNPVLDEESAKFLSKMADLSEKEIGFINKGDKVAGWFDRRVTSSGFFLGWFWVIFGVCFLFFVFLPLFYVVDAGFRLIEWRNSRVLGRLRKKAKLRKL